MQVSLHKYDGKTGKQITHAKELLRSDDVEQLLYALDRMLTDLKLGNDEL